MMFYSVCEVGQGMIPQEINKLKTWNNISFIFGKIEKFENSSSILEFS